MEAELWALLEKATREPWGDLGHAIVSPSGDAELGNWMVAERVRWEEDRRLIVAMRNHLPALLSALAGMREENNTLRLGLPSHVLPITERNTRQAVVVEWCTAAFGEGAAGSIPQRGVRLLEEAIELYQAAGCEAAMAHKLVDFVFARPVGKLGKEIGQVGLVLLSMAGAAGLSADAEEAREVVRVREKPPEHYAERNKAKNAAGFDTAATVQKVTAGEPRGEADT